jgi:hypothetical protein
LMYSSNRTTIFIPHSQHDTVVQPQYDYSSELLPTIH